MNTSPLANQVPSEPPDPNAPFYPHSWSRDGDRCTICGDKDWMGGSCIQPPPQDEALKYTHKETKHDHQSE